MRTSVDQSAHQDHFANNLFAVLSIANEISNKNAEKTTQPFILKL